MKKICVCGHFGGNRSFYDGQTVKTKNIYSELIKIYGRTNIYKIDTYNWKLNVCGLMIKCIKYTITCDDIIILPAHNGVKLFIPLFNCLCKLFHKKLHYVMIGGWLPKMIANNTFMKKQLRKVNYIYAETQKVIDEFADLNINNVCFMRNFKNLECTKAESNIGDTNPIKCCIFSRIEKQKGINDAVDVINRLNHNCTEKVHLDIYGKIAPEYEEELKEKIKDSINIEYKGVVDADKSVQTLENYNLLLFPTRYPTEGIPGTIIDAYFAGVPVISSRWESFGEVVIENETGIGYEMYNIDDFYKKLGELINDKKKINYMRNKCLIESQKYNPKNALKILLDNIGE